MTADAFGTRSEYLRPEQYNHSVLQTTGMLRLQAYLTCSIERLQLAWLCQSIRLIMPIGTFNQPFTTSQGLWLDDLALAALRPWHYHMNSRYFML